MTIENESFSTVEHHGVEFPAYHQPRCNTCRHSSRLLIESWWVEGLRPPQIVERLGEDPGVSASSITNHMNNGHAQVSEMDLMIQRAADHGMTVEALEQSKRTEIFTVELAVDKFRKRLADPEFQPDFKDGIAAIKLLHELTEATQTDGFDPNDVFVILSTFLSHTRTVLTRYLPLQVEEAMHHLGLLFEKDPVLRQIIDRTTEDEMDTGMFSERDSDVVDAEIIEETFDSPRGGVIPSSKEEGEWDSYFE